MSYADDMIQAFRIFWLGPATEPGVWAIDSGPGTPVWRVHTWEACGLVRGDQLSVNAPANAPRPRGWIVVHPENAIRLEAPQGLFLHGYRDRMQVQAEFDPAFVECYRKYGVKV